MTLFHKFLQIVGNRTRYSPDKRYEAFYSSYSGSTTQSKSNRYQTLFWVAGTVLSQVIPGLFNKRAPVHLPFVDFSLPPGVVVIAAFGIVAILLVLVIGPGWYYWKNGPFKYKPTWYPITTKPELLRDSHGDKLRLPDEKVRIVVYFDVLGKIDGYNFKMSTTNENITFELYPERSGISQQSYSDGKGVYSSKSVENNTIFNIYEIEKSLPLGGDPGHKLRIFDVPKENPDGYSREVTNEKAEKTGNEILSIEVTE